MEIILVGYLPLRSKFTAEDIDPQFYIAAERLLGKQFAVVTTLNALTLFARENADSVEYNNETLSVLFKIGVQRLEPSIICDLASILHRTDKVVIALIQKISESDPEDPKVCNPDRGYFYIELTNEGSTLRIRPHWLSNDCLLPRQRNIALSQHGRLGSFIHAAVTGDNQVEFSVWKATTIINRLQGYAYDDYFQSIIDTHQVVSKIVDLFSQTGEKK